MRISLGPWRSLGHASVAASGRLGLPAPPPGPGLYRFLLAAPTRSVYVGETEDLRRRFYQYCNPGPTQRTNQRMSARMLVAISAGGTVAVEVCVAATIEVGSSSEPLDLRVKSHRLMAEEAALEAARGSELGTVENAGG
jgi:hypothetical protein